MGLRESAIVSKAERLESGDISFFYRPRVDDPEVSSFDEVQRLLIVLRPWSKQVLRLLIVGRKRLPDVGEHERVWCFVDLVTRDPDEMRAALDERRLVTRTRGERFQPPARPAGEGAYVIARHDDHTHLVVLLELPECPGEVQRALNIEAQASYIVAVRNPQAPAPPGLGRPWRAPPDLPPDLLARFGGRRFAPLDPPDFLDHPGVELVLIAATADPARELDLDLRAEAEAAAHHSLVDELRPGRERWPLEPLFTGEWR